MLGDAQVWWRIYIFTVTASWCSSGWQRGVQLRVFSCSLRTMSLWPAEADAGNRAEGERLDVMLPSLPCSAKLRTGALFIRQTGPWSSNSLTKKFRISWQHQSGSTTKWMTFFFWCKWYPEWKKEELFLSVYAMVLMLELSCSLESLTSLPPAPLRLRQEYADLNASSSDWGGEWRIVNDGQIIGVCCSSPSSLWSGDREETGSAAGLTQQKSPFKVGTHINCLHPIPIIAL